MSDALTLRAASTLARYCLLATLGFVAWLKLSSLFNAGTTGVTAQAALPAVSVAAGIVEVVAAILLVGARYRWGAWIAFWLSFVFGMGFTYIVLAGLPTRSCGCFGTWEAPLLAHYGIILSMMLLSRFVLVSGPSGQVPSLGG